MFARGVRLVQERVDARVISSRAAMPACWCRSSRCRRARAGASARSRDLPRLAPWLADGGLLDSCSCCRSTRWPEGQNSPYSAMSAMAIDPIFISPCRGAGLRRARRRGAARRRPNAQLPRARAGVRRSTTRPSARSRPARSRAAFDRFRERRVGRGRPARALRSPYFDRAKAGGSTTTRSSARCTRERTAVTGATGPRGAARPATRPLAEARAGSWRPRSCSTPYLQWLADEPVAQARDGVRSSACSAISRSWSAATAPTSGRGSTTSASMRRSARRPMRSPRPVRTGGFPAYRWDVVAARRLRVARASAPGAARSSTTATASITSSASIAPTSASAIGEAAFTPPDRAVADRAGRADARILARRRRADHCRGSRRDPRLRPRVAGAAARSPAQGAALGAGLGRAGPAVQGSAAVSASDRWRSAARTTPRRWRSGGTRRRSRNARRCRARSHGLAPAAIPTAPFNDTTRDACCSVLYAAGSDFVLLPIQDVFGWRDRINMPAVVYDENWTWRLPWPVEDLATGSDPSGRRSSARWQRNTSGRSRSPKASHRTCSAVESAEWLRRSHPPPGRRRPHGGKSSRLVFLRCTRRVGMRFSDIRQVYCTGMGWQRRHGSQGPDSPRGSSRRFPASPCARRALRRPYSRMRSPPGAARAQRSRLTVHHPNEGDLTRRKESPRRVGEADERRALALLRVEPEQPHPDTGRALHVTGLGHEQLGTHAMFRLDPPRSFIITGGPRQQIGGHLLREGEMFRIARDTVQVEHELRDAGRTAALAHVVPESGRALFGDAAREQRVRRAVNHVIHALSPVACASW